MFRRHSDAAFKHGFTIFHGDSEAIIFDQDCDSGSDRSMIVGQESNPYLWLNWCMRII
jgi:hypothetical protein